MIIRGLIIIIGSFISGLASLLPDVNLNSNILASVNNIAGWLGTANQFFPITTLLTIFAVLVSVEATILIYKSIMWIVRKIPGIS